MSRDLDAVLEEIHRRLRGGLDITTFGDNPAGTTGVEIRWRRVDQDGTVGLERWTSAKTLLGALLNLVAAEDEFERAEAEETAGDEASVLQS